MFQRSAADLQCQVTDEGSKWCSESSHYDFCHNPGSRRISVQIQIQSQVLARFELHVLDWVGSVHCL